MCRPFSGSQRTLQESMTFSSTLFAAIHSWAPSQPKTIQKPHRCKYSQSTQFYPHSNYNYSLPTRFMPELPELTHWSCYNSQSAHVSLLGCKYWKRISCCWPTISACSGQNLTVMFTMTHHYTQVLLMCCMRSNLGTHLIGLFHWWRGPILRQSSK